MMNIRKIFAISLIAIMSVNAANAATTEEGIASIAYVDREIDTINKKIPTVNNATLTIQKNGTTVDTFTANASANKTINVTVPTKTSDLTNDSNFATTSAVNAKVSTAQGTANAGKGLVVNASGNLELQDIATQAELNTVSGKIPTGTLASKNTVTNAEVADGALSQAKIDGLTTALDGKQDALTAGAYITITKDTTTGKTTIASTGPTYKLPTASDTLLGGVKVDTALSATSTNPVQNKAVNTALAGKQATLSTAQLAAANSGITKDKVTAYDGLDAKITAAKTAADNAQTTATAAQTAAGKAVVANAAITANTIGATKIKYDSKGLVTGSASLTADDIPTLATAKITGLDTALSGKEVAANRVTSTTDVSTDAASTTKYPSMATANKMIDNKLLATTNAINAETAAREEADEDLAEQISAKQDASTAVKHTANAAVGSATVPVYVAANGTVTAITSYSGKAATAGTADKATADGSGNNIVNTYATKAQLNALDSTSTGTGAVVTGVTQTDGKVAVTKGNVQIPVGSATGTTYATIWVE